MKSQFVSSHVLLGVLLSVALVLVSVQYGNIFIGIIYRELGLHALINLLSDVDSSSESLDTAIDCFQMAILWNPKDARTHRLIGRAYVASGQFASGIDYLRQLIDFYPDRKTIKRDISYASITAWQKQAESTLYDLTQILGLAETHYENGQNYESFCWSQPDKIVEKCTVGSVFRVSNGILIRSLHQKLGSQLTYRLTLPSASAILRFQPFLDVSEQKIPGMAVQFQVSVTSSNSHKPVLTYRGSVSPGQPDDKDIKLPLMEYANNTVDITFEVFPVLPSDTLSATLVWADPRIDYWYNGSESSSFSQDSELTKLDLDGYDIDYYLMKAKDMLDHKLYEETLRWLQLSMLKDKAQKKNLSFQASLAAILASGNAPKYVDPISISIHRIGEAAIEINGGQLQWMYADSTYGVAYGDSLDKYPLSGVTAGVMWWSESAVAVLNVGNAGVYRLTLRAMEEGPSAGAILIERNFALLATVPLSPEWKQEDVLLDLPAGFTILGVRYMSDAGDALIDWIKLEKED